MIHRVFAYVVDPFVSAQFEHEVTVFFESPPGVDPHTFAIKMLAQLWHVPEAAVEAYNCTPEQQLLDQAAGPHSTGDARLLEVGFGGEDPIHYAEPRQTLLLLRPRSLDRVVKAQALAAALRVFHKTTRGRASLEDYWAAEREAFAAAQTHKAAA